MEQLEGLLGAADVRLTDEVLDGIDAIVPSGTGVNPSNYGWTAPSLAIFWGRRCPYPAC